MADFGTLRKSKRKIKENIPSAPNPRLQVHCLQLHAGIHPSLRICVGWVHFLECFHPGFFLTRFWVCKPQVKCPRPSWGMFFCVLLSFVLHQSPPPYSQMAHSKTNSGFLEPQPVLGPMYAHTPVIRFFLSHKRLFTVSLWPRKMSIWLPLSCGGHSLVK